MRKTVKAALVVGTAFVLPVLSGGSAYAADTSAVSDAVKAGGGCVTTYEAALLANKLGPLYGVSGLDVTVKGSSVTAYEAATVYDTNVFIGCVY